ncbi:hypothetical protein EVB39_074 [Rhizobium phage RHph_TM3_3_9]|nr:hypothetical protein EVB39_074 [Rhizobium phage RHph_TM3_3_9]QIG68595.1 hypothetical protein EVB66_074 [Rhizobium phage RHph_TM3_3_13]QIG74453.1 hypothetical protein EVC09_073 [Rhizobium phage RHph_TM3_3_10]QXV74567.1 hypothetical protein [Rhizobium phage RHEph19]
MTRDRLRNFTIGTGGVNGIAVSIDHDWAGPHSYFMCFTVETIGM